MSKISIMGMTFEEGSEPDFGSIYRIREGASGVHEYGLYSDDISKLALITNAAPGSSAQCDDTKDVYRLTKDGWMKLGEPGEISTPATDIIERTATSIYNRSAQTVGDYFAYNNEVVESVYMPNVKTIGESAFAYDTSLVTVDFPEATLIKETAFYRCSNLEEVICPELKEISSRAFADCTNLKTVIAPKLEKIYTFSGCTHLEELNFPLLNYIGSFGFSGCASLVNVDLPQLEYWGERSFYNCTSLKTLNLPMVSKFSGMDSSSAYIENCSALESVNLSSLESLERANLFRNCPSLTSVSLPNLKTVGSSWRIFRECSALEEIYLPKVEKVGGIAVREFVLCTSLKAVYLPVATYINFAIDLTSLETVNVPLCETIGGSCFKNDTALETLNFPCVTSIGTEAFSGCTSLTTIIFGAETVATLDNSNAFTNTPVASGTGYIYVPDELVNDYKAAQNWSTYANQIKPISELPTETEGE